MSTLVWVSIFFPAKSLPSRAPATCLRFWLGGLVPFGFFFDVQSCRNRAFAFALFAEPAYHLFDMSLYPIFDLSLSVLI